MSNPCENNSPYRPESDNRRESSGSDGTGVEATARQVNSSSTDHNLSSFTESKEDSYSSGIFSPDMFNENDEDKFFIYNEDFNIYNQKIIKKIEKSLQGVPPHPSITISQLTVEEMLNLYNTNLAKFEGSESAVDRPSSSKDCDKSYDSNGGNSSYSNLVQGSSKQNDYFFEDDQKRTSSCWIGSDELQDMAVNGKWPDITTCRYYGIHYNTSSYTEEVDRLLSQYLSRYVGCETASSCVLTCCKSPLKKGLRSNIGRSPAKSLIFMTRRRIEMCTAKNFKGAIAPNRQVYIDRKKLGNIKIDRLQNVRRSPRLKKTPKKSSLRKKTPKSRTPGSKKKSASKRMETPKKSLSAKKGTKRALFLSPEAEMNPETSQGPSSSLLNNSKRILFESPTKESPTKTPVSSKKNEQLCKKRKLDDSFSNPDNSNRAKLRKSLTFGGDKMDEINQPQSGIKPLTRHASEQMPNKLQQMSSLHNKKLLWAVAEALRAHNIGLKHDQFKLYMASLTKLTRKLVTLPFHARMLSIPGTSTSDTLLKIARQHSFPVIRGKSVDDIFKEEQQKQTVAQASKALGRTPLKIFESITLPQSGSINIKNCENAYGNLKNGKSSCGSNAKTVLQDKTINIETKVPYVSDPLFESSLKKNMNNRTTMLLHKASRQIHFDEVDDNFMR